MTTLRFALVGCGRIAEKHAELLGNRVVSGGILVSVCDINNSKARKLSEKYSVTFYSDFHDMMRLEDIDVVVVLTESGNHAKIVLELAPYKKHIMVEKPLALTLHDADRMIESCDKQRTKLFVIKQNRFNLPVVKLREVIESGRFGKLVLGSVRVRWCRTQDYYDLAPWRGTWAQDGGVLTNQASHHIDLLEWMMGEIESVFAKASTALVDIEVEDTAIVVLRFRNGALGVIEATTAARPSDLEGSLSILGENGAVEIGGFAVNQIKTWKFIKEEPLDSAVLENFSENPPNVYGFGHKAYYDHVVNCIVNNGPNLVDGFEARKSLEVINAIYESIETQREVYLRFNPKFCKLGRSPESF